MAGHAFVVPGSLQALDCDDVVVPTDHDVNVTRLWTDVLGWRDNPDKRDRDVRSVGRLSRLRPFVQLPEDGDRRRWLLSVGSSGGSVDVLAEAIRRCLEAISDRSVGRGRVLQRVALPTLGVSRGGFGQQRGAVIQALLEVADDVARRRSLDVVFVAFNPADYSAFQSVRRGMADRSLPQLDATARALAGLARAGNLALFMGAGTGMSAGLPSWSGLLERLAMRVDVAYDEATWRSLSPLDAAELLRRAAQKKLPGAENALGRLVAEEIRPIRRYALGHVLLASLRCEQVITTNFDQLYETATAEMGDSQPVVVLPRSTGRELAGASGTGWLLKLHGDISDETSIVLDRRSFVTYDARRRPLGGVLQTTLLTKHLLVVGASMTDDNVIRLVHEVAELSEQSGRTPQLGTVLTLRKDDLREQLWAPEFTYVDLSSGADLQGAARNLEVFLDKVAMHATTTNRHLLSASYASLLGDDDERELAQQVRGIAGRIAAMKEDGWRALGVALREFGA